MAYTEKTWKEKAMEERKKKKQLESEIRDMKREIIRLLNELEEKVKDIMYVEGK